MLDQAPDWRAGVFTGGALEGAFLDQADLIVTVGFDAVEMIPTEWRWPATVVRRAQTPRPALCRGPPRKRWVPLEQLYRSSPQRWPLTPAPQLTEAEVAAPRATQATNGCWPAGPAGVNPTQAVQQLVNSFPSASFSVDAGAHMFAATLALAHEGAQRCSISNGLATMGYALPAAVGMTYAEPERPAVAITGDGGLSMCLTELETAVRSGHRLVLFLLNDAQLSLIKIKQEAKGARAARRRVQATDWPTIAAGFGPRLPGNHRGRVVRLRRPPATRGRRLHQVVIAQGGYAGLMETVRGKRPQPAAVINEA